MIASKVICDDTYSNKLWCVVGQGMFSLREINQMEREVCAYLEWVLTVPKEELEVFEAKLKNEYSSDRPPKSMLPIVTSTSLPMPPRSAPGSVTTLPSPPLAAAIASPTMSDAVVLRIPQQQLSPPEEELVFPSSASSSSLTIAVTFGLVNARLLDLPNSTLGGVVKSSQRSGAQHPQVPKNRWSVRAAPAVW